MKTGTERTRRFYDEKGWKVETGASVDHNLFGVREDGPIRVELHRLHVERIRSALSRLGSPLNLLECGCGGSPGREFLDLCARYTGVDFSETGINLSRASFADVAIPYDFQKADVCALPFDDGAFDAVYSAHMIYHIEDAMAQDAAVTEMLRVVKPGGVVVIVTANPRPLAFPIRLARRLLADMPFIGSMLQRLRAKPVLPYNPMRIGWFLRRLDRYGTTEVTTYSIPSTHFYQNVSEFTGIGKPLWKILRWMDINFPTLSAYLGNYVTLICTKHR